MKKLLLVFFIFFTTSLVVLAQENNILPSQIGKVINIQYLEEKDNDLHVKQLVEIKLLSGELKNKFMQVENVLSGNPFYDIKLKKGRKVILHAEDINGNINFSIADIFRWDILAGLFTLFSLLLIFVGQKKGINSLLAILITCIFIAKFLSPMIIAGFNPVLATVLISLISTAITMYLVGGFNKKSTSAVLGCTLSLFFAGILSIITIKLASLNGFSDEHSLFLYSAFPHLDFISILVSTMILATLGAVMDVAMSISSTISEIYEIDNSKSKKSLFKSGMNVGRDIIGTMANTLILVYLGSTLPLLLLASNIDMQKFFNLNQVVTEISSALIGSCAIIICVPITALVTANLITKKSYKFAFFEKQD